MSLAEYTIWVIDDDIPVQLLPDDLPMHDSVFNGDRPIDHGLLCTLVKQEGWRDDRVREICEELTKATAQIQAFRHPENALRYLGGGISTPDLIVYDLEYDVSKGKSEEIDDILCKILNQSFSLVQVYTTADPATAKTKLAKAFGGDYQKRLSDPQMKSDCDATRLTSLIDNKLKESFSEKMAHLVRRASHQAIERTLIGFDDLSPLSAIETLIGKRGNADRVKEQNLVSLLGTKVSDALLKDEAIKQAFKAYASEVIGDEQFSAQQIIMDLAVSRFIELLSAAVKNKIQQNGELFDTIQKTADTINKQQGTAVNEVAINGRVFPQTRFAHFWHYSDPSDDVVRTGDIVEMVLKTAEENPAGNLYFVITPQCDIEEFWKKTRGCLTAIPLNNLSDIKTKELLNRNGNPKIEFETSIIKISGSQGPVLFPAVRINADGAEDYVLLSHQIQSFLLTKPEMEGNKIILTYSVLNATAEIQKIKRIVKMSEPFLTGVLEHISRTVFQSGIPDLLADEKKRINESLE